MTDHIKTLQKAREQTIKARREIAEQLSQPYDPNKTPRSRTLFIEVQSTIDQIDKAITDEQKATWSNPAKAFAGGDDRYSENPPEGYR
jgi:hypothetical protein